MSLFKKIKKVFSFGGKKDLDGTTLEELEEKLILADFGVGLVRTLLPKKPSEGLRDSVSAKLLQILQPKEKNLSLNNAEAPYVAFFCGVNGSGKTTTIGKLATKLTREGRKVLVAACDTFRAAASEQLKIWAERANCYIELPIRENEDPSAVAYRAMKRAREEGFDALLIDTSGRLHTNKGLMDELQKIFNVVKKQGAKKPDDTILVLDASVGQNALAQVREYSRFVKLDGIIMTKLDSSSKGGVLASVVSEFDFGVFMVGLGEGVEDLVPFNAEEFVENIF